MDTDSPTVNIVDVFPDATQGPAGDITEGCVVFDVFGGRHEVTRIWKGRATISLARDGEAEASIHWPLNEQVTYVPKPPQLVA
jgi:hypothetical protein